jgi:quercetin dioxygenase-like cupin family protein
MTTHSSAEDPVDTADTESLMQALAIEIASKASRAQARPAVRLRLIDRVRESAALSREMVTVRHGDSPWQIVAPGVSMRLLHDNGITRARLIALQPAAQWQQHHACEVLVMQGVVHIGGIDEALPAESFALCASGARWEGQGALGSLLYVRELYGDRSRLPAAEQAWWPTAGQAPAVVPASEQGWLPFSAGVELKPLHGTSASISTLARFAPGAAVAAHGHELDEDCIMLRGDLYLSDTLLREGEYQLAPAGTGHRGLASDGGAVLFFHGAIDEQLRGG